MTSTTINLDEPTQRKLEELAAARGVSPEAIMREALEKELAPMRRQSAEARRDSDLWSDGHSGADVGRDAGDRRIGHRAQEQAVKRRNRRFGLYRHLGTDVQDTVRVGLQRLELTHSQCADLANTCR